MADRTRLQLTLRNRTNGREWTGQRVEITADPDNHDTLLAQLEAMARDLDGRTGDPWWLDQYTLRVKGIDQAWRNFEFTVGGN